MVREIIADKIERFVESVDTCTVEDIEANLHIAKAENHIKKTLTRNPNLAYKIIDIGIPPATVLEGLALSKNPNLVLNELHDVTYRLMLDFRAKYYEFRVERFVSASGFPENLKGELKLKLLQPVQAGGVSYSNFMEEVSRRVSQTFQPVSGKLAEFAVERELKGLGLLKRVHYRIRPDKRTDIEVYYPSLANQSKKHRIEIKNVSLRERGERGLEFDGDSLLGFFNQADEFTASKVQSIDGSCLKTGGYCYVPPKLLDQIKPGVRFRINTRFATDMKNFVNTGSIPIS